MIELFAVHTIEEKIGKIQHDSLTAFFFYDIDYIVIGIRMIFYQYFSDNAYFRFFHI